MRATVLPLTLAVAHDIAARLCHTHRSDVLRDYPTVGDWAKSRVELPGLAWAFSRERPILAGGLLERGRTATLWLAGCEGWTRYVRHVIRLWRIGLENAPYERYECEVHEADPISRQFAERLGFEQLDARGGIVLYGVTPRQSNAVH